MTAEEWQAQMNACDNEADFRRLMALKPRGAGLNSLTRQGGHVGEVSIGGDQSVGIDVRVSDGAADRPLLAKLQSGPRRRAIPRR